MKHIAIGDHVYFLGIESAGQRVVRLEVKEIEDYKTKNPYVITDDPRYNFVLAKHCFTSLEDLLKDFKKQLLDIYRDARDEVSVYAAKNNINLEVK